MRCCYLSDLHLEAQTFDHALPGGDVLIIAGDLAHARCLDPGQADRYCLTQSDRVRRLIDEARRKFTHVLLIAGNHEHYDGVFETTVDLLRRALPGVTVLDDDAVDIAGVRFYGATFWTDLSGRSEAELTAIRRGKGDYFFVKTRSAPDQPLVKLRPADTHRAHTLAWARLRAALAAAPDRQTVVITHHAPSALGLNPLLIGDPLQPVYANALDAEIAAFANVPVWVHGHTHVAKTYQIGATVVRSNALGRVGKERSAASFSAKAHFEIG